MEILILRLYSEDQDVRLSGANGLASMGAEASSALPALRDCAVSEQGADQQACESAVRSIDTIMIGMAGGLNLVSCLRGARPTRGVRRCGGGGSCGRVRREDACDSQRSARPKGWAQAVPKVREPAGRRGIQSRGAINNVAQLSRSELDCGLITYSSGNHAQAVAWAAHRFGARATICMPTSAPRYQGRWRTLVGADVVFVGTTSIERRDRALEIQRDSGGVIIEPFDHPRTIAGQGTVALEFIEQVDRMTDGAGLQAMVVPVGGGGLIAGACLASASRPVKLYAVEPEGCDSMRCSIEAGGVVAVEPGPTLADGLKPTRVGELPLAICQQRLAGCFTVDDRAIGRALVDLLLLAKILVEPSAAAALALLLAVPCQRRSSASELFYREGTWRRTASAASSSNTLHWDEWPVGPG